MNNRNARRIILVALPASLVLPALAIAQSAFVGTWKADINNNIQLPDKSFSSLLADGVYQCITCAPAYTVKADGKDHKVAGHPYFDSVRIKIVDDRTIVETDKKGGKTVTLATTKVAGNGLTETFEVTDSSNSNGAPVKVKGENTLVTKGPAGSHASSGSWRVTKYENVSDNGLLVTLAMDGAKLKMSNPTGQSFSAPLDGTDSPFMGDPGQTSVSLMRVNDRTIDETDKRDGKVIGTEHMTVAADGKTMKVEWKDLLHDSKGSFTNVKQ
jgi:hypothetical protein